MSMDRRRFLVTSLAGAVPTGLLTPAAAAPQMPTASPAPSAPAAHILVLSNELLNLSAVVESYGRLLLQEMEDAHRLHATLALRQIGQHLREQTMRLHALVMDFPPSTAVSSEPLSLPWGACYPSFTPSREPRTWPTKG